MGLKYVSTRNADEVVTASEAILKGLADESGLFVPTQIPPLTVSWEKLSRMRYQDLAYEVMKLYLTDFTEEELRTCIERAYDAKFDTPEIASLKEADGAYFLELFHGATIAFKDMALSILPHLMTVSARKNQITDEIVILTATSGDTGKAAMAGFADVEGTRIVVFYPKDGVSAIQERQMVTQKGDNTFVVGIHGNFDEAQTAVKQMFTDPQLKEELREAGFRFSSANSINIGRLVPQIAYYVYAYAQLVKRGVVAPGDEINIDVPTGNFGNILAAYYAKKMGLPVHRLLCASNENKVLYDFFQTGVYDKNREFFVTSSPSMDILVSSNLERLIYQICGSDARKNTALMKELSQNGTYAVSPEMREKLGCFYGGWCSQEETARTIRDLYEKEGYVIDTHTAVAAGVYRKYRQETGDLLPTVIASTASPYKFPQAVVSAIDPSCSETDDFALIGKVHALAGGKVPQAVEELIGAPVRHDVQCDVSGMPDTVRSFLGLSE